jgi:hypothetical protein
MNICLVGAELFHADDNDDDDDDDNNNNNLFSIPEIHQSGYRICH